MKTSIILLVLIFVVSCQTKGKHTRGNEAQASVVNDAAIVKQSDLVRQAVPLTVASVEAWEKAKPQVLLKKENFEVSVEAGTVSFYRREPMEEIKNTTFYWIDGPIYGIIEVRFSEEGVIDKAVFSPGSLELPYLELNINLE